MKYAVLSAMLFLFVLGTAAQSGRRVAKPPTPPTAPTSTTQDDGEYSESKPSGGPTYSRKVMAKEASRTVQPKDDTKVSGDEDTIKVSTDLVTIPVSVYERGGVYVTGLRRNDFKIFEDGKEQEVSYFGTIEQPVSVILLIDTSPSTSFKITDIQNAAINFVDHLKPVDKVMVIEFNSGVSTHCDFTNDRSVIDKAIRKTSFGGGTALYSAVETALKKKLAGIEGRKAIVLFTDGVDTVSRSAGYQNTLALAEEGEAVIFPVYFNTYLDMRGIGSGGVMSTPPTIGGPTGPRGSGTTSEEYTHGRTYLQELARVTGGQMFRAESTIGGLNAAFEGLAEELSNQYVIGYYPNDAGTPGQRKQLKVRVNRPNVAIRARDNYIVGETGSAVKSGTK